MCVCVLCESEQERQKKKQVELPYHCPLGFFFFLRFFLSAATQANLDTPPDHIQACRVVLSSKNVPLVQLTHCWVHPQTSPCPSHSCCFLFPLAPRKTGATPTTSDTRKCLNQPLFVCLDCVFFCDNDDNFVGRSSIILPFNPNHTQERERERERESEKERERERETDREREKRTHTHARIEANFLTLCCCLIDGWCVLVVQHRNFCCSQACCQARCSPACWQGMA